MGGLVGRRSGSVRRGGCSVERQSEGYSARLAVFLPWKQNITLLGRTKQTLPTLLHRLSNRLPSRMDDHPLIFIFPPMKDRISQLLTEEPTSNRKRKSSLQQTAEQEAVLENARINPHDSCLTRLTRLFPALHPLLQDADLLPIHNTLQPEPSMPPSSPADLHNPDPATLQRLQTVYGTYQPVHEQVQELKRMISGLRRAGKTRAQQYMETVHLEYVRLGGRRSVQQLQEKLQADLIFLIRRENERPQYEKHKYY